MQGQFQFLDYVLYNTKYTKISTIRKLPYGNYPLYGIMKPGLVLIHVRTHTNMIIQWVIFQGTQFTSHFNRKNGCLTKCGDASTANLRILLAIIIIGDTILTRTGYYNDNATLALTVSGGWPSVRVPWPTTPPLP